MVEIAINKSDEDFIREFSEFKGNYLTIDKDRLILFVINYLEEKKIESTLDKITAATFRLFPKKFHLIGFPEYPDGLTIYTCFWLHNTKTKKWLTGSVQSGFKITEKGRYFLEETKKMIEGKIKITKIQKVIPKRKEVTFIEMLKKTEAYIKYYTNNTKGISNSEIFTALKISEDDSSEALEKHLKKYLEYANRINDESSIEFLEFIKQKIPRRKNAVT